MIYRKLFEPEYGEVAPEVHIDAPLPDVFENQKPSVVRTRFQAETAADINILLRRCNCYEPMMQVKVRDFAADGNGRKVPVRVFYPVTEEKHSLMVFYHGGGFVFHNPTVFDSITRYLARFGGITVVSVEYSLAPEHPYPEGLEDAYTGLEWAAEHAEELGADRKWLSVCGDSAGGNLAAAVALMARDRKGPEIQKQILVYPLVVQHLDKRTQSELRYGKGYFLEYDSTGNTIGGYLRKKEEASEAYASPLLAESLENLPEACFISAECDPLLDQALMYAARLEDMGGKVDFHIYKGMLHGFLNLTYGQTFEALNEICTYVNNR